MSNVVCSFRYQMVRPYTVIVLLTSITWYLTLHEKSNFVNVIGHQSVIPSAVCTTLA